MSAAESSTGQLAAATVEEVMESAAKLSEALHTDFRARDVLRATTIASAAAEARWTVEALAACTGKNAEQRKAEFDLALLDARSPGGVLFATYTEGLDAQRHAWRAGTDLDIAKAAFSAAKSGAAVIAAMLSAGE